MAKKCFTCFIIYVTKGEINTMEVNLVNSSQSFKGLVNYHNKQNLAEQISSLKGTDAEDMIQPVIQGINMLKKGIEENTPDTFECTIAASTSKKYGYFIKKSSRQWESTRSSSLDNFLNLELKCKKPGKLKGETFKQSFRLSRMEKSTNAKEFLEQISKFMNNISNYANSTGQQERDIAFFRKNMQGIEIYKQLGE